MPLTTTICLATLVMIGAMTNHASGHAAEKSAADYLVKLGFKIIDMNWKTRYCEIDIIAEKDSAIYLVEVKSRQNSSQGYGLDYITPAKIRQMRFAAEMWVSNNDWQGEYQLAAIGIDGKEMVFIDEL